MYYCALTGMLSADPPEESKGGILAEEMGLGKTIEVLALLAITHATSRQWQADKPLGRPKPRGGTLIVCPVSLFGQWKTEIRSKLKDGNQLSIYEYHSGRTYDKNIIAKADIVLTTFSILNREQDGVKQKNLPDIVSPIKEIEWFRVVLDECHSVKQANTKQALFCFSLETKRRWAVTGTILQTKHDDIAGPLQFLRLDPFGRSYIWNRFLGGGSLLAGNFQARTRLYVQAA
jgi:SNF2 family DNA or RNA helicase